MYLKFLNICNVFNWYTTNFRKDKLFQNTMLLARQRTIVCNVN
jgi:hypothetical protein